MSLGEMIKQKFWTEQTYLPKNLNNSS